MEDKRESASQRDREKQTDIERERQRRTERDRDEQREKVPTAASTLRPPPVVPR